MESVHHILFSELLLLIVLYGCPAFLLGAFVQGLFLFKRRAESDSQRVKVVACLVVTRFLAVPLTFALWLGSGVLAVSDVFLFDLVLLPSIVAELILIPSLIAVFGFWSRTNLEPA